MSSGVHKKMFRTHGRMHVQYYQVPTDIRRGTKTGTSFIFDLMLPEVEVKQVSTILTENDIPGSSSFWTFLLLNERIRSTEHNCICFVCY